MSTTDTRHPSEPSTPLALRVTLFSLGSVSLALGVLGVVLPLVPTTPFILLAAGCYARAWPPAHRWLRQNRFFGPVVRSGAEGRYLPVRAKAIAITMTVASFGATIVLAPIPWPVKAVLAVLCIAVTTWLVRLPTEPRTAPQPVRSEADSRR